MIVRFAGDNTLLDAHALYIHLRQTIAIQTIRARCTPARRDAETGRWLYDLEAATEALTDVRARRPHMRRRAA